MKNIKDIEKSERPREKALKFGLESLKDEELLALIIGSGTKDNSVLDISEYILKTYKNLANFALENYKGISSIKGLKQSKTLLILAMFEFHKRVMKENAKEVENIKNAFDIYKKYYHLSYENQEVLLLILLNKKNQIIKEIELYRGTKDSIEINLKDIISEILIGQGSSFILIHNHPSGTLSPSESDLITTDRLARKSASLDIEMKDHIIITKGGFYSFREQKLL